MPKIKAQIIDHEPDEEHILRRLGKAVAIQWDGLGEKDRFAILAQAGMVHDEYETVQLKQQIEGFIEKHRHLGRI